MASPFPLSPHKAIAIEPGAFDAQFGNGIIDNATLQRLLGITTRWTQPAQDVLAPDYQPPARVAPVLPRR